MHVYFISGLGADRTVFKHLHLPAHCKAFYLDWIPPQHAESLPAYAQRLSKSIVTTHPFVLVGLSMGGMLAVEIAKQLQPNHTIIISSIPSLQQLPFYYKAARTLRLHKIIPIRFLQQVALLKRLFTSETAADKQMLKAMIRNCDAAFIRWALHAILSWENKDIPKKLVHVHGTRDAILPLRFVRPTHVIRGGGHLMVLNRAREINQILQQVLVDERLPDAH